LGRAHLVLKEYDDAEKCLNQAIASGNSDLSLAYKYLGVLYDHKGETAKAIEALEKYLSLAPKARDAEQVKKIIEDLRRQKN
jgi:tetratricopeptide (TPR) repeat protein